MSTLIQEVLVNNQDRISGDDCDFTVRLANDALLDDSYSHVAISQVAVKGTAVTINGNNNRLYFAVNTQAIITNYTNDFNINAEDFDGSARSFEKLDYTNPERPRFVSAKPENNFITYIDIPVGSYTPDTLVTAINAQTFPADEAYTNFNLNAPIYRNFDGERLPFWGFYKGRGFAGFSTNVEARVGTSQTLHSFNGIQDYPVEKPNFRPFASYDPATEKITLSIVYDGTITPGTTTQGGGVNFNQFVISNWRTPFWGDSDENFNFQNDMNFADNKYFLYPGSWRQRERTQSLFEESSEFPNDLDEQTRAVQTGYFANVTVLATVIPYFQSNLFFFDTPRDLNTKLGYGGDSTFFKNVTYNGGVNTFDRTLLKRYVNADGTIANTLTAPKTFNSTFSSVTFKNLNFDDSQFWESFTAANTSTTLFTTGITWLLCSNITRRPIISTHPNVVEALCMIPCNDTGEYSLTEFVYDHDFEIEPGILRNLRFKITDFEGSKLDFTGDINILLRFKKLNMISENVKRQRLF